MIDNFFGSNKLSSRSSFQERALYKEYAMERYENLNLMDFWYENPYYGILDKEGYAVYPQEQLFELHDSSEAIYGVDFVVRAYRAFYFDFISKIVGKYGTGNQQSALINIQPEVGTPSFAGLYESYQESIFQAFYSSLSDNGIFRKKIRDFHTFLNYYFYFLNDIMASTPFTRTAFIKSPACPYNASGLIVDIKKNMDFSSDFLKKFNFIDDNAFTVYAESAARHGFSVDKNAPWRLVARIGSTKMKIFMKLVDVNPDKVFEERYIRAYTIDYEDFKLSAISFYEAFATSYPKDTYPGYSAKTGKFTYGTIRRKPFESEDFGKYPETFWLKKYYERRLLEENMSLTRVQISNNIKKYAMLYRRNSIEEAIRIMEKDLAKLPPLAIPSVRKKIFNYGELDPQTVVYSGKKQNESIAVPTSTNSNNNGDTPSGGGGSY